MDFYHPPYSPSNPTNNILIDKIIKLLTEVSPLSNNHTFLGDLNLHVSDQNDVEAQICSDSTEALRSTQHCTIQTHKSNNVPDLIFTEIMSDIRVEVVETTSYISDHCPVIATLNIKKEQVKQVQSVICKVAKISQDEWNQEFTKLNIGSHNNLCNLIDQLSQSV